MSWADCDHNMPPAATPEAASTTGNLCPGDTGELPWETRSARILSIHFLRERVHA